MLEDDDDNDSIIEENRDDIRNMHKSHGIDNDADDDDAAEMSVMRGKEAESSNRGKNNRRNHR